MLHAIVTFLEDEKSLEGVDSEFRGLVRSFHQIPFCATFGVSCAGHLSETEDNGSQQASFSPSPWGHLNIIVLSDVLHIQELLSLLKEKILGYADTSFKKIQHIFGPQENSRLAVWEIRINDNGCLGQIKMGENWFGGDLSRQGNEEAYENSKARFEEIKRFWKALEDEVMKFCKEHSFISEGFMLEERVTELVKIWNQETQEEKG